jgi:hypothetical protein
VDARIHQPVPEKCLRRATHWPAPIAVPSRVFETILVHRAEIPLGTRYQTNLLIIRYRKTPAMEATNHSRRRGTHLRSTSHCPTPRAAADHRENRNEFESASGSE